MTLRQLHEIMLGSQELIIYRYDHYEPEFNGYNSSIPDDIISEDIDVVFSSKDHDRIVITLK